MLFVLTLQEMAGNHLICPNTRRGCTECGEKKLGTKCAIDRDCPHMRSLFNSTKNLKRRVHTFLFWKRMLGISFPVTDCMLEENAWKSLESCTYGIK